MTLMPLSKRATQHAFSLPQKDGVYRMTQWVPLSQLSVPNRFRIQLGDPEIQHTITQHMTQLTEDPTCCPAIRVFPKTYRIWKYWTWFEAAKALGWETIPINTGQTPNFKENPKPIPVKPLTRHLLHSRHQTTCEYCGKNLFETPPATMPIREWNVRHRPTLDHRMPRSQGGTSRLTNLAVVCAACNNRKNNRWPWRIPLDLIYEAIEVNRQWPQ